MLGSILLACADNSEIFEQVQPESFYSRRHEILFRAIRELYDEQGVVDTILLKEKLERESQLDEAGGLDYILEITDVVRTSVNASRYANIVREHHTLRRLIEVCRTVMQGAFDGVQDTTRYVEDAEKQIFEIAEHRMKSGTISLAEAIKNTFDRLDKLSQGPTGVMCGFVDLDKLTHGLQPSELVIVAGRPSMGKTTLAMNVARNVATAKKGVLVFSLEVDATQMAMNLLCGTARVSGSKLRGFSLSDRDWARLTAAADQLSEAPIFIDDSPGLNVMSLRAKARRMKAKHDIQLIVIDYLQLLEMGGNSRQESRQQEITAISRSLKSLARELGVPVVTLSQLSRAVESRESHRPRMSDLRESGAIEQDADLILLLYREEYYSPDKEEAKGKAEVIVAKHRNGPVGSVHLAFINDELRFDNLAHYQEEF